jgi:tetraacyldisaccharide 4'-kinase
MREPSFWRRNGLLPRLLTPAAALYGAIADMRMHRSGHSAGAAVFCVGNPTLGGAGKTPTAIAIARLLLARGERVFFLTRGYGGKLSGPVLVQPGHTAQQVGDEPLLLARVAPTVVARNRVAGANLAVQSGASAIVMDDGFQNPSLAKDFSLLVIDGERGLGNGRVFPAGPLRASLTPQIGRADAILVVGPIAKDTHKILKKAKARAVPVLTARLAPDMSVVSRLRGLGVLAYAGIGHPQKFYATLAAANIAVRQTRDFSDHHVLTAEEATELLNVAAQERLYLVTTEKDMARMQGYPALGRLADATTALPVSMSFDDQEAIERNVVDRFLHASYGTPR